MKIKIFPTHKVEPVLFYTFNTAFMIFLVAATLYPFLNTLAVSLNEGLDTVRGGIFLWPRKFSFQNYIAVFEGGLIVNAFLISVSRTVLTTVLNVFLTTMLAYPLSRSEYVFRKPITTIFVLTMYFNAGLFPVYFLIKGLGLRNNFLVYVVPYLISAFNMIVVRTYIRTLPESMIESAKMDGAGDFRIFLQIIFPLCKPVLATIALFVAVGAWNTWFDTYLYASSRQSLSTLQFELMKRLSTAVSSMNMQQGLNPTQMIKNYITPVSLRAAITIVASVPILLVYPFLQRHFIMGLSVGSVKE